MVTREVVGSAVGELEPNEEVFAAEKLAGELGERRMWLPTKCKRPAIQLVSGRKQLVGGVDAWKDAGVSGDVREPSALPALRLFLWLRGAQFGGEMVHDISAMQPLAGVWGGVRAA
uniref:Uncharacterized protein n=1 Tax=Oryza punctata TaxID=4537 RepID=A0A0E0LS07_ORYPU